VVCKTSKINFSAYPDILPLSDFGRFSEYNKIMLNSFAGILKNKPLLTVFIVVCYGILCSLGCRQTVQANESTVFQVERIAHAGGGYEGQTYTNSYQALSANLKAGFVYFELDFFYQRQSFSLPA
jgi:hypothetical protein